MSHIESSEASATSRTPAGLARVAVAALVGSSLAMAGINGDAAAAERAPGNPPSVVLILADDLGYGDVSCQGREDVGTPHIDSLARGGVRFTDGYVSCPVCSPTRAGLVTGRYQQRFGHEFNLEGDLSDLGVRKILGLPNEEITIADILKQAGYVTGIGRHRWSRRDGRGEAPPASR